MQTNRPLPGNSRPGASARLVLAAAIAAAWPTLHAQAVDVLKANNSDPLNLTNSWVGGAAPGSGDVAVWDSTVLGANTSPLGSDLSWQGIRIANPGGLATVTHAAGQILTLGASGIDLSAATQNLTLMSAAVANTAGTLAIDSAQTWSVGTGRNLTLFSTSNSANQRLSGFGNITVTGPGTVTMNVGDLGSTTFAAGNGNDTYSGNWTINGGAKVLSLRNGTHAFGTGTITLDNGTISQQQGNWSWSNHIAIAAGGGKIMNDSSGNARYMNLTGIISGAHALTFDSLAAMTTNEGFILTGNNTHTGPMVINANATVRIGGNATTTMNSNAAGPLGSIDPGAAITNNGILGFGRTDAHTIANAISGTGIVRLGRVGGVLPTTQVVTLSGASTYTGATQVNAGRLNLTGSLTSAITVASGSDLSGTGSTTGLLTMNADSDLFLAGGAATTSLTANGGVTFAGATTVKFEAAPLAGTVYDVVTYGPGALTNFANLTAAARGTFADTTTKVTFTAGAAGTRTWNVTTGNWDQGLTNNWAEGDQKFFNGDTVIFNEPAAASAVTLVGALSPAAVTVNNTANAYTFGGSGTITGATGLTKTGAGALTLSSNAHSFTGDVLISGGTVETGTTQGGGINGYLGAVSGGRTITVSSGATLRFLANNQFGGMGKMAETIPDVVIDGATVNSTRFNILGNVTLNNAATLSQSTTDAGTYDGYEFIGGTITVGGTGASTISTGNGSANHLAGGRTTTFDVGNATGDAAGDLIVSATLRDGSGDYAGAGGLTKTGAGTLQLAATNTYTGATTVDAGTVLVSGALSGTTAVNLNGGALELGANNVLNDFAMVTMGGGTLATGGFSETVGSLTLNVSSTIDLGAGASILRFADSFGFWSDGALLTITNWSGLAAGGGTDQLFFGTSEFGLGTNVAALRFENPAGFAPGIYGAEILATGEVVAMIPEPGTMVSLLGGLGVLLGRRRSRRAN